jgi:hypothetical protein
MFLMPALSAPKRIQKHTKLVNLLEQIKAKAEKLPIPSEW